MPVETPSLFAQVIRDHLELKEKNSDLDRRMPIDRYRSDDPFDNHPLFKTEEQARLEETMDGVEPDFVVAHSAVANLPWPVLLRSNGPWHPKSAARRWIAIPCLR